MEKYDIIIIGSGLGGLVCANILSKEGYKVCVLEKNSAFGGCLRSYRRKDRIIDTGIHYVGRLDEGQILNRYFKYMGILDRLKLRRLDEDGYDIIRLADKEYKHAMGSDNFIETLCHSFPNERENIRRIVTQFKKVGDLINVEMLRSQHLFSGDVLPYFNCSALAFLKESTTNQTLRNAIAGAAILSGGEEENTSLYTFATILNSNIESSYRFVDGSQQVADLLIECIQAQGGVVRNRSEVTRLVVKNNRITGVEINRSEYIEGDSFISGIHPAALLDILDKTKYIKKAYISHIHSLRNSTGFFSLSILLKNNTFPYLNRNYYYYNENNPWISPDYAKCSKRLVFFCTSASSGSDSYAKAVQILEPMYRSEVAEWEHTSINNRGEEYEIFKQQRAEKLIEYIEQFHPGLKEAIEEYITSTPLTYRDYTGTRDGSAYGIIKDYNDVLICLLPVKTKIPNLFITGQNNNVHGMIGVFLTAMYTCSEFVGTQYLAKKVANV